MTNPKPKPKREWEKDFRNRVVKGLRLSGSQVDWLCINISQLLEKHNQEIAKELKKYHCGKHKRLLAKLNQAEEK